MSALEIPLLPSLYLVHTTNRDLDIVPDTLRAKNFTYIGKIIGIESLKVQIYPTTPSSKLPQYSLTPEAKKRHQIHLEALYRKVFSYPTLVLVTLPSCQQGNEADGNIHLFKTSGPSAKLLSLASLQHLGQIQSCHQFFLKPLASP